MKYNFLIENKNKYKINKMTIWMKIPIVKYFKKKKKMKIKIKIKINNFINKTVKWYRLNKMWEIRLICFNKKFFLTILTKSQ